MQNSDVQDAVEALIESDSYINKKAAEPTAQSLFQDYQMLLNLAFWQALLSKHEDPESFMNKIRSDWEERSTTFLKSEAKRFQEVILKSSATEGKKLPSELNNIFSDYSRTMTTAFGQAAKAVDEISEVLLKHVTQKKETEND
jgi:hypothetical protein